MAESCLVLSLCLFSAATLAGLGPTIVGAARLGASIIKPTGWRVALVCDLGMSILAATSIAGLFQAGAQLSRSPTAKRAFALLLVSNVLHMLPKFAVKVSGGLHTLRNPF